MKTTTLRNLFLAGLVPALPALAQDVREMSTPTAHWYHYGASVADLNATIANGYRITDIEVESTSPLRFTATLVHDSGAYASGWWWYYGLTSAQLSGFLAQNTGRLIDLEPYEVNGSTRFACVMVPNTGSQQKAWWYYYGTSPLFINAQVAVNNARIVDIDSYEIGGSTYYSAVMIQNTGSDQRGWWWYYNVSPLFINTHVAANSTRVYDIERRDNGNFNVVLIQDVQPQHWTWWYGLTAQGVADKLGNYGHRPIDLETYSVNGQRRFAMATINNSNALTTNVGDLMRGTTDGIVGAYLKEMNSGVQAWLNGNRRFEPASTMKTLHHVHAMRRVRLGAVSLLTPLTVFTAMNGSCPVDNNPVIEPLTDVLRAMMEQSDNARTQAVAAFFGVNNINATAQALGMSDTSINHRIGCGGPAILAPNQTTLDDLSRLHEQVVNGYLGGYRNVFYEHMLNGLGWGGIGGIIDQEAAPLGLSAAKIAAFKEQTELAQKGGSYTLISNGQTREHRAGFGRIQVPFLSNGGVLDPREFAVGAFVNDATNGNNAGNAVSQAVGELLRPTLRAALRTWARYPLLGSAVPFGRGCGGRVQHTHTTSGVPTLGGTFDLQSNGAAPGSFAVLALGFSDQLWNGTQLPTPVIPGTTCMAYCSIAVTATRLSDATGFASIPLRIPNDNSFLAATFFTQYYAFSSSGLTTSNGMRLVIGE